MGKIGTIASIIHELRLLQLPTFIRYLIMLFSEFRKDMGIAQKAPLITKKESTHSLSRQSRLKLKFFLRGSYTPFPLASMLLGLPEKSCAR